MKMKKRLLSILLSLVMALGLMPGMSLTAYAVTETYTNLMNSTTVVKFNNHDWYIIADDSTATGGTVTLLAADTSFGTSAFDSTSPYSNAYSSSTVKGVLDALTAEDGAFASVKDAIADTDLSDVGVFGAKLYLLSTSEAEPYKNFKFSGAEDGSWWLRSQGSGSPGAAIVYGKTGHVYGHGSVVSTQLGVRPALKLNLSSVIFDSESKTFSLKPSKETAVVTTAPTAKTLTYTGSAQELVTAGTASGGTMQYAIGKDATTAPTSGWSTSIPTATSAGTYYVWYKAVGDSSHTDSEPACVTATISQVQEQITINKKPILKKAKAKKIRATITWNKFKRKTKAQKKIWKRIKQIEVQWSTNPNFPKELTNKKIIGKRKIKTNITGLKRKTRYFVRVRYCDGQNGYSRWSKVRKFKTK